MTKYRIQIDPPLPDRERIARYKDFDSLYGQYQSHARFEFWRSLYRKPQNFAVLAVVVAILVLVFRAAEPPAETRAFRLHPPKVQLDIGVQVQPIDIREARQVALSPDIQLGVPAMAFQDSNGEVISGEISLQYRLLSDPASMFVAGVPRPNKEAAIANIQLVEVYATQNQQRLYLREGYPLEISWRTMSDPASMVVQQLDTEAGAWTDPLRSRWESQTEATPGPRPTRPAILDQAADTLIAKGTSAPQRPGKPFGVMLANPDDYPEFSRYAKVYWEHVPRTGTANPWTDGLVDPNNGWADVSVRKLPQPNLYELRFSRIDAAGNLSMKRVAARPMFEAKDDGEAEAIWAKRMQAYRDAVAATARQDSLINMHQQAIAKAQQRYEAALAAWEAQVQAPHTTVNLLRYELAQLGVSGMWQLISESTPSPIPWSSSSDEVSQPSPQMLPWSYATKGDTILALRMDDTGQLLASGPFQSLWWTEDSTLNRLQPTLSDGKQSLTQQPLSAWKRVEAFLSWLRV